MPQTFGGLTTTELNRLRELEDKAYQRFMDTQQFYVEDWLEDGDLEDWQILTRQRGQ